MPPRVSKKENVNWTYKGKIDFKVPENAIGFTYRIDILDNYYYGKKYLTSTRGKGKKAVISESNWRVYNSSSVELKALIKAGKKYKKEILKFCYSKAELSYEEAKEIICNNSLIDDKCLNKWIILKVWQHQLSNKKL